MDPELRRLANDHDTFSGTMHTLGNILIERFKRGERSRADFVYRR